MAIFEIPLSPQNQRFNIQLGLTEYTLALTYRDVADGGWVMDISDAEGNSILAGIPLITGADLLEQYRHLGLGGALIVATDADPDAVPGFAALGGPSRLYWVTG